MIEVKNAVKNFGKIKALQDVSFTIHDGKITGLLGISGSGKSTSLKAISGLLHLTGGEILIDNEEPSMKTKEKIAYLPEIDTLYPWMKISDAMNYMKDIYKDWDELKAEKLLKYFNLEKQMKIKTISKGMRAKVKLLLTLSRKSKYILLDEPLSGIDVLAREDLIKALVDDFLEEEQTIVITTHEVKEIESILDDVLIMENGKIVLQGNVEDLKQEKQKSLVEIMREVCHYETI